jgi:hypothetical protein
MAPLPLVVVLVAAPVQAQDRDDGPVITDLDGLRALVRRQERLVRFVSGRAAGLKTADEAGRSVRNGEVLLSFVREGDPCGRSLLDYTRNTLISNDRQRVYVVSSLLGYDGSVSWSLERSTMLEGRDEAPVALRTAQVTHDRSIAHYTEACTGWCATLPGFYEQRKSYFSDVLERAEVPFELRVAEDGDLVLSCRSKGDAVLEQWELPREWSHCLRRYTKTNAAGLLLQSYVISEAVQLHAEFWYPKTVSFHTTDFGGQQNQRLELALDDIQLMAHVSASVFQPRFPHGTVVTDVTTGHTVTVAAPDAELSKIIDEQAVDMRQLVLYEPSASRPWLLASAIVGGVLAIAGSLWLRASWRRRTKRNVTPPGRRRHLADVSLSAALAALLSTAPRAQAPWCMRYLCEQYGDNCALNASLLACAYFQVDVSACVMADRLGCSHYRTESVSLDRIGAAIDEVGLSARGFRRATLEDVGGQCAEQSAIAVVHVAAGGPSGHYYVVTAIDNKLVVADPSYEVYCGALGDPRMTRLASRFTGCGVLITNVERRTAWSLCTQGDWSVSLGKVGRTPRVVSIPVTNDGPCALSLKKHDSTCGCVEDVVMEPMTLGPGHRGEIRLRLDGARLHGGVARQRIGLTFDVAGRARNREIRIETARSDEPASALPCVVPSLAFADATKDRQSHALVHVVVPNRGRVAGWTGSDGVEATPSVVESIEGGVTQAYRVDWTGDRAMLVFRVLDVGGTETRVPCFLRAVREVGPVSGAR